MLGQVLGALSLKTWESTRNGSPTTTSQLCELSTHTCLLVGCLL